MVFTITTAWKPKDVIFFKKFEIDEIEFCCARDNTELAGVEDHRVSYFLSLCPQDVVFWNAGR